MFEKEDIQDITTVKTSLKYIETSVDEIKEAIKQISALTVSVTELKGRNEVTEEKVKNVGKKIEDHICLDQDMNINSINLKPVWITLAVAIIFDVVSISFTIFDYFKVIPKVH